MDNRLLATIIIFPIWLVLVIVFRRHRQWLFYYLGGAFGLTLMLVFLAEYLGLDQILVNVASFHVDLLAKAIFRIPIELLTNGRFQILMPDGSSSILKLGIECSAILESSIILSLIIFYPLFNWGQKILRASFGLIVTYVINIIRLIIIVLMADKFGSDYIFLAHAGVARVFFFVCELLLYWYLMTKPTVKSVGESIFTHKKLEKAAKVGHALRLKHAYGQLATIILFIILVSGSFIFSTEWHQAFSQFVSQERPIIYQEETSLEPSPSAKTTDDKSPGPKEVMGESAQKEFSIVGQLNFQLYAGEEANLNWIVNEDTNPPAGWAGLNLEGLNIGQRLLLEIYLNDGFQNRTVVAKNAQVLLSQPINPFQGDYLTIVVKNLGENEGKYTINLVKEE